MSEQRPSAPEGMTEANYAEVWAEYHRYLREDDPGDPGTESGFLALARVLNIPSDVVALHRRQAAELKRFNERGAAQCQ